MIVAHVINFYSIAGRQRNDFAERGVFGQRVEECDQFLVVEVQRVAHAQRCRLEVGAESADVQLRCGTVRMRHERHPNACLLLASAMSMSSSVWAEETNSASNCEGAR